MKTHPRVGGEALVSFSCTRAFALSRAIALTRPDFWDPAGLSSDGSVENFKRRRQTELKHGRISTAPILQQRLHMPWVNAVGEASRCATYLYGAFSKFLFETMMLILMMCITLTFCHKHSWLWSCFVLILGIVSQYLLMQSFAKRKPQRCRRIGDRRCSYRRRHWRHSKLKWRTIFLAYCCIRFHNFLALPSREQCKNLQECAMPCSRLLVLSLFTF